MKCFARVINLDRIVLNHKQNVGSDLVHALSVANVRIQLAESKEDVAEHSLILRFSSELEHTPFNILQYLGAQILVFAQLLPGGRSLAWFSPGQDTSSSS